MVIEVNVGYVWELPRLACLCWHKLEMRRDAGWGVKPGRRETTTSY